MAGRGPAPKDPEKRARGARGESVVKLDASPAGQPALPEGVAWTSATVEWWRVWGDAPQAVSFTELDWQFLLGAALLHHKVWGEGEVKHLAELRLEVAKFGATPEDRARLRMQFAEPGPSGDAPARPVSSPVVERFAGLRAV